MHVNELQHFLPESKVIKPYLKPQLGSEFKFCQGFYLFRRVLLYLADKMLEVREIGMDVFLFDLNLKLPHVFHKFSHFFERR